MDLVGEKIFYKMLLSTDEIHAIRVALVTDIQKMQAIRDNDYQTDKPFWQARIDAAASTLEVFNDETRREWVA